MGTFTRTFPSVVIGAILALYWRGLLELLRWLIWLFLRLILDTVKDDQPAPGNADAAAHPNARVATEGDPVVYSPTAELEEATTVKRYPFETDWPEQETRRVAVTDLEHGIW